MPRQELMNLPNQVICPRREHWQLVVADIVDWMVTGFAVHDEMRFVAER